MITLYHINNKINKTMELFIIETHLFTVLYQLYLLFREKKKEMRNNRFFSTVSLVFFIHFYERFLENYIGF